MEVKHGQGRGSSEGSPKWRAWASLRGCHTKAHGGARQCQLPGRRGRGAGVKSPEEEDLTSLLEEEQGVQEDHVSLFKKSKRSTWLLVPLMGKEEAKSRWEPSGIGPWRLAFLGVETRGVTGLTRVAKGSA